MEFYILHCTMCKFVLYMQNVTNQLSVTVASLKLKTFVAMTTMAWLCGYDGYDMFFLSRGQRFHLWVWTWKSNPDFRFQIITSDHEVKKTGFRSFQLVAPPLHHTYTDKNFDVGNCDFASRKTWLFWQLLVPTC